MLIGYTRDELIGRELWEIGLFQDIESNKEAFHTLQQDGHIQYDNLPLRTKDGGKIDVEFVSNAYDVGGIRVIQCNVRDITERKRAEGQLNLRDRAIRAASQGIIITDPNLPDNPIVYVSPGFERITGYESGDAIGLNCRFLQCSDTDPAAVVRLRYAIRLGEPCTVELLNCRKDGTRFWNELSISPVHDAAGRLTNFVGVQSDVTARRNLEEQFRQMQKLEAVGQLAGGILNIETRNVELDAAYAQTHTDARAGPHVLLSVADTGTGMPPDVAARIFEPFFTTKGIGKGTGLGLATVYGIVKQSGGHIAVYSEVGIGTTFKVYLPCVEEATVAVKGRSWLQPPSRGTETVLVVEDEDGVRALTRRILAGCGYTVLEAANGNEALCVLAAYLGPIHLLVSDVVMPGIGGRVVAERVAELHPGAKVLFVSGYTDDAVIRHGVLQEGVNFLQKPFSAARLAIRVREVLDNPR